jgi:RNA polymerase sigma factor (sigma-70 family)
MTESQTLLADYVRTGSEAAFKGLVERYVGLVYSTALRLVGQDTHLAEDVAQAVFTHLAVKAHRLSQDVLLGGWLHRDTCFVAATLLRSERRRRIRETEVWEMNAQPDHSEANLERIAPVLDAAINRLGQEERQAIVLRFFEHSDFRTVGAVLGSTEEAARKRVSRALEKLRLLLQRQGVSLSAAGLATLLTADALTAAPAGLAANLAGSALASAAGTGGITLTFLKLFTMSKLKFAALAALAVAGVAIPWTIQQHSVSRLRTQNFALQQQLQQAQETATEQLALAKAGTDELERLRRDQGELARLRGEVSRLRRELNTPASSSPRSEQASSESVTNASPDWLTGTLNVHLGTGQTVVTGGWSSGSGQRLLVFATPKIEGPNFDQVRIKTMLVSVPETLMGQFGLGALQVEGNASKVSAVIGADDSAAVIKALAQTEGVSLLNEASVSTLSGRQTQIQVMDSGSINNPPSAEEWGPTFDFVPTVSEDKSSLDLKLVSVCNRKWQPKSGRQS